VKTKQTIRGIVPVHVAPLLEEYLETRHLLVGEVDPGTLFLNRAGGKHRGGPLSKEAFGNLIGGLTQKYAGRWRPRISTAMLWHFTGLKNIPRTICRSASTSGPRT
jgi:hypothetical protein